jgi:hypothetical protein
MRSHYYTIKHEVNIMVARITLWKQTARLLELVPTLDRPQAERVVEELHAIQAMHPLACCPKAKQRFCVCRISFSCPDHGSSCHGSHD